MNFHFETYLYQYKEKMSRTRQQMNITEETMELSLIDIGYGEQSVQETYFTALLLKLDQTSYMNGKSTANQSTHF